MQNRRGEIQLFAHLDRSERGDIDIFKRGETSPTMMVRNKEHTTNVLGVALVQKQIMFLPGSSETAEKFITALQMLTQDCNFKDPEETIGDRIVFSTNPLKVRENLTSEVTKLDPGAQGNILQMRLYREVYQHQVDNNGKLKANAMLSSNVVLTAFGSSQIKRHGIAPYPALMGKEAYSHPFT